MVVTSNLFEPLAVLSALDLLGVKLVRLVEWLRKCLSDYRGESKLISIIETCFLELSITCWEFISERALSLV